MDLDFVDSVTRGLHDYARSVARVLGVSGDGWSVQSEHPAEVYLALDVRLARFPDRDVALLWDELAGWSVAVETGSGEELVLVESYGDELNPAPRAVAEWALEVFGRRPVGQVRLLVPREAGVDDRGTSALADLLPEPRSA